ncbi:MAG: sulfurtransferase [Magnetococcales bacterium]|nr:sulfurtransferase [Magnetococcales bacterium]
MADLEQSAFESPELFVSCDWLEKHLSNPNLRVVQLGGEMFYHRVHIPGAVLVSMRDLIAMRDGVPGMRRDPEEISELFGRLGITRETTVVAYDATGGLDAAKVIWNLFLMGHERATILDGGINVWAADERPMVGDVPNIEPVDFYGTFDNIYEADKSYVEQIVNGTVTARLLDTRSYQEYTGMGVRRGPMGHIPGARFYDWITALADRQRPVLKSAHALMDELKEIGIEDTQVEVVCYCQTAHRAAHTWMLLKWLGFQKVRLYDGSMSEWGLRGGTLVAGDAPG